jgi:plasmid maintenance system antidote protein VapI
MTSSRKSSRSPLAWRCGSASCAENGPDLWLNLQKRFDLHQAEQELGEKIKDIPTLEVA